MLVWPGQPYPLGATFDGAGTNFAVFSEIAERVELCLFDGVATRPAYELTEVDAFVWHGYLHGRPARDSCTAIGCTAPTTRRRGSAATPPSCCSTPMPRR